MAFEVLVATDGSRAAHAAVATTLAWPWPPGARVSGVVARRTMSTAGRPGYVIAAWDRQWARVTASATHALRRRFPDAQVALVDDNPGDAIVGEAKRLGADVIVMGWRGHGAFRRLLVGSVSRDVVRRATCAVLVTRRRPREIKRFVIGIDGSATARRATGLIARLAPPRGSQVTLVRVVESAPATSLRLMPSAVRRALRREAGEMKETARRQAARELDEAAAHLAAAGWKTRQVLATGAPLAQLLAATAAADAHALVIGGRGHSSIERLVLGSVAQGALDRAPVPVLVVP